MTPADSARPEAIAAKLAVLGFELHELDAFLDEIGGAPSWALVAPREGRSP
jgi:hypothetical protein